MEYPDDIARDLITRVKPSISKISYTHDAMIDLIINDPRISNSSLAAHFGYTQAWISTIKHSDAFQARLAQRRLEIIDPALTMSMEERIKALQSRSLEVLQEKLAGPTESISDDLAIKAAKLGIEYTVANKTPALQNEVSTDRLERLAGRLTHLLNNQRGDVTDVTPTESTSAVEDGQPVLEAQPGDDSPGEGWEEQLPQTDGGESDGGLRESDRNSSGREG